MVASDNGKGNVSGFLIERTAKELKRAFQLTLQKIRAGITADQWVVLNLLYQEGDGNSQSEISRRTGKDSPTLTRIIDLLEKKGLIKREQDPDDRRKFRIFLTEKGITKVTLLLPKVREFRLRHFEGLTEQDVNHLVRIMDRISKNIQTTQNP